MSEKNLLMKKDFLLEKMLFRFGLLDIIFEEFLFWFDII